MFQTSEVVSVVVHSHLVVCFSTSFSVVTRWVQSSVTDVLNVAPFFSMSAFKSAVGRIIINIQVVESYTKSALGIGGSYLVSDWEKSRPRR